MGFLSNEITTSFIWSTGGRIGKRISAQLHYFHYTSDLMYNFESTKTIKTNNNNRCKSKDAGK